MRLKATTRVRVRFDFVIQLDEAVLTCPNLGPPLDLILDVIKAPVIKRFRRATVEPGAKVDISLDYRRSK